MILMDERNDIPKEEIEALFKAMAENPLSRLEMVHFKSEYPVEFNLINELYLKRSQ